jgi:tRNA threonylcarbamoyladenosine modification (KEOPS) complex Cgi121 subunit
VLKQIEEFGKHVEIAGFRNVKIKNVEEFLKVTRKVRPTVDIQFFDAHLVATWEHLYFATLNALKAFRNGESISKSLAMETMLYASAQRQIRKATELIGIKQTTPSVAVLIIGEKPEGVKSAFSAISMSIGGVVDDVVLQLSREKVRRIRRAFGITERELQTAMRKNDSGRALVNLVIERVALLATQR